MAVTSTDNQEVELKKKLKKIYELSLSSHEAGDCPIRNIFEPTVDKWSLFCLFNLAYNKTLRFNKLKSYIPGISSRMLSVTLKKLEAAELVTRRVYPEVPPRVEYSLTDFGYAFSEKLVNLNVWLFEKMRDGVEKK